MRKSVLTITLSVTILILTLVSQAAASPASPGWSSRVPFTNQVADDVITGGGYAGYDPGAEAPNPGSCRLGFYNANRSESWIAVKPGTEDLIGTSKIFFEKFSTFYNFHLGAHTFRNGNYTGSSMVTGYDCVSTGTQEMPPSWTNNTDPNVDFDTQGRAYQVTLPFNAFWANLHPNSNIGIVYSDDLGRTWVKGNGGQPLEHAPNWSSLSFGFVEDKQWIAVNHFPATANQDHVYAMWSVFNGFTSKIKVAVSRDRGQTFSKAQTLTMPSETGPSNTFIYPSVGVDGTVYASLAAFPACCSSPATIYVARSTDDGVTWGPFVKVVSGLQTVSHLPNTTFRDGILEHFAASPTYPGHLYLVYEAWDGTQMDVAFTQSTDGGITWSAPIIVNDNVDAPGIPTDQFQPQVAAGPGGAVAVNFYDRRLPCPDDPSVLPANVGRANLCIDVSLQAFRDDGSGAVPVGGNVRISEFTWDPEQPRQKIDGIDQYACAGHRDPCPTGRGFIGDYFGLAISGKNVYSFFVSTHYPSDVISDDGSPVYYQQQVLATVKRSALGI